MPPHKQPMLIQTLSQAQEEAKVTSSPANHHHPSPTQTAMCFDKASPSIPYNPTQQRATEHGSSSFGTGGRNTERAPLHQQQDFCCTQEVHPLAQGNVSAVASQATTRTVVCVPQKLSTPMNVLSEPYAGASFVLCLQLRSTLSRMQRASSVGWVIIR